MYISSSARWDAQLKRIGGAGKALSGSDAGGGTAKRKTRGAGWHGVSKRDMQKEAPKKYQEKVFEESKESEEPRAKEALELVQKKHVLVKWAVEREKARMLQRSGSSRVTRHWNDARDDMSVESCSPSLACDVEAADSESSREMMQDKEETTSEASWTAVTKGKEKEVWRLEPEGEAERPEATVLWNGVDGVSVNPEGESRHGQVRAKMARKEKSDKNGCIV